MAVFRETPSMIKPGRMLIHGRFQMGVFGAYGTYDWAINGGGASNIEISRTTKTGSTVYKFAASDAGGTLYYENKTTGATGLTASTGVQYIGPGDSGYVYLIPGSAIGVVEDTTNHILYLTYNDGVTLESELQTAIGVAAPTEWQAVGAGGAVALSSVSGHVFYNEETNDQESALVTGTTTRTLTAYFTSGVSTTTEVVAKIVALGLGEFDATEGTPATINTGVVTPSQTVNTGAVNQVAVGSPNGNRWTVSQTATGTYVITFSDYFPSIDAAVAQLNLYTIANGNVQIKSFSAANKQLTIYTHQSGTLADIASGSSGLLSFYVIASNTTA